ncbi:MAG TPA: DUF3619 family protein [Geobacteraceae bacterium]
MKNDDRDRITAEKIRQKLDAGASRLDAGTLARLQEARLRALTSARRDRRGRLSLPFVPRWMTAGGLAAAAVVILSVSFWVATPRTPLPIQQTDEVEILTSQEHLDLYADLEFYRWLAADDQSR